MKFKFIFTITSIFSVLMSLAQPANNNCSGAIVLIPGATCVPISGTTAGATQSQPACSGSANDDVWYTFTANANSLNIVVVGSSTFNAVVQLFAGTCGGASIACMNSTGTGGTETINATSLVVGNQYWVRVHHFPSSIASNPTFTICVTQPYVEPPCDPNSVEPYNWPSPCANVPKICQVNGFCGTTQGYHATPTATTLTPYTPNVWPQLNTAFCGSIENNSFMRFTANAATVQLRIYGSCASGTGIQMLAFSYVTPNVCGSGNIISYGCTSPLTFPSPAAGIPLVFTGMVPGQDYYLMVDGFAGAICNYKIGADYGVQVTANVNPSVASMCLGNSVPLNASGGNGTYTWNPDPTLSALVGATVVATPNTLGTFTYVVNSPSADPACPGSSDTSVLSVFAQPTPLAGADDSICLGSSILLNGTISNASNAVFWEYVPPVGTTPTVTFTPNQSSAATSVMVSQPGLYKFILRETNTICGQIRDTLSVLVFDPQLTISSTQPTCLGYSDGIITISSAEAVEYSFDSTVTWQLPNTSSGYISDTFSVCVKDLLGCVTCDTVVVQTPPEVTIAVSNDTIVCENGTATLIAAGNIGTSFSYHWSQTTDLLDTQLVSPITAGYYSVYAENQDGCISSSDSIFVDLFPVLSGTITPDFAICPGDNALISSTAGGGNGGPYSFTWSNGTIGNGFNSSINESPAATTVYQIEIADGCETTHQFYTMTLTVSPVPDPQFAVLKDSICEDAIFNLFNTTDPNMVASSIWQITDGQAFTNLDTIVTNKMGHGSYDVILTITSPDGCIGQTTVPGALVSMPLPKANFRYSPNTVTAFSTLVNMENMSIGNYLNHWSFEEGNPAYSSLVEPEVLFPEGIVNNYKIQLIAETDFGCLDSMYQIIEIKPEVILYAPNSFTPDDDEFNATWGIKVEGIDLSDFELKIYDRWGEVVWVSHDPTAEWDGTFKGQLVQTGSYNWTIRAKDALTSDSYIWKGNIILLK